jgi:hypothetical protein
MVALRDLFHDRMQATANAEVETPPAVVWQVITDIESHPNLFRASSWSSALWLVTLERSRPVNTPNKGKLLEVGTK